MFGQIAESRAKLAGARTPEQTMQAANEQSAALSRLLVISENYPQLRSSEQFGRLMDELSGTENRIAVERMRYNERVPKEAFKEAGAGILELPKILKAGFESGTKHFFVEQDYTPGDPLVSLKKSFEYLKTQG